MKIGNSNVMPSGWGSSGKNRAAKVPKRRKEIFKIAVQLGFKATAMNPHQAKKAEAFLAKRLIEIEEKLKPQTNPL